MKRFSTAADACLVLCLLLGGLLLMAKPHAGLAATFSLDTSSSYDRLYTGDTPAPRLTQGNRMLTADVNGDGLGDLLVGSDLADLGGTNTGGWWVSPRRYSPASAAPATPCRSRPLPTTWPALRVRLPRT